MRHSLQRWPASALSAMAVIAVTSVSGNARAQVGSACGIEVLPSPQKVTCLDASENGLTVRLPITIGIAAPVTTLTAIGV